MNVLIQNPSNLNISTSSIAVPSANYEVTAFNFYSHLYVDVVSYELQCSKEPGYAMPFEENFEGGNKVKEEIENCKLIIEHVTPAYGFSLLKIKYLSDYAHPGNAELTSQGVL